MRITVGLLLSAVVTVSTVVALTVVSGAHRAPSTSGVGAAEAAQVAEAAPAQERALAVVHAWDRRRGAAWAHGDTRALARLYTVGSHTGRRDVAALRSYDGRGLHVVDVHRQVLEFRLVSHTAGRVVVRIRGRVVDAVAVGDDGNVALPTARPTAYLMVLVHTADGWKVGEAYGRPPNADARTPVTSRSRNS